MSDETPTQEAPATEVAEGVEGTAGSTAKADAGKAPEAERKYKLKFGPSERELSEKELIIAAQKGWAADERFQSASKKEKQIKDALDKSDMDAILRSKGLDPNEFYKERLKAQLRQMTMSPEEKEREDAKAELAALKKEADEIKKGKETEKSKALEAHYVAQYDKELSEAIDKNGLPRSRIAIKRAADIASKVVDMGLDPDWDLIVKETKRLLVEEVKELMGSYKDDNALLDLLGEDFPKRIGKAMQSRGNTVVGKAQPRVAGNTTKQSADTGKPVDMAQWFKDRKKQFENS